MICVHNMDLMSDIWHYSLLQVTSLRQKAETYILLLLFLVVIIIIIYCLFSTLLLACMKNALLQLARVKTEMSPGLRGR